MAGQADDLTELLEQLNDPTKPIPFSQLYDLSDLAGSHWAQFREAWLLFPANLRRRLIRALVELTESSFEVNFDAIFRFSLQDPDEEVRASAIDGLWENEEVSLIGPMLSMLRSDPSARVRAAAAGGLGRFVLAGQLEKLAEPIEDRIVTELMTAFHLVGETVEVRRRAIESVSYACTPEVVEAIELAYYDEDEAMRLSAVTSMGRSCDRRWSHIILEELESSSTAMRYEAAWACGEIMMRPAVPRLARLMYDPDPQVASASIWALGQIGGAEAKAALLEAYEDADADTREAIEEALAEHALAEGDIEFTLYAVDRDLDEDLLDDDLFPMWSADDLDEDVLDPDDWQPGDL